MVPNRFSRPRFALAAILGVVLTIAWFAAGATYAHGDDGSSCLSRDECRLLRQELRQYRQEIRPMRRHLRDLLRQIRQLDPDDPLRAELIEQARQAKQRLRHTRRQRRPLLQRFRRGCQPHCFDSGLV